MPLLMKWKNGLPAGVPIANYQRPYAIKKKLDFDLPNHLPQIFRRPRLLIVGYGDIAQRVAALPMVRHWRVRAIVRDAAKKPFLRAQGVLPLYADLDEPKTLWRLGRLAPWVLHLAPPPTQSGLSHDPRTAALVHALWRGGGVVKRCVYGSTTGVYGDAQGDFVQETRAVAPQTARAQRRVDAERSLRHWAGRQRATQSPVCLTVLRIPGIYALNRPGGDPRERLARQMPVLCAQDDVFTNHIHADDLARACALTLFRGKPQRVLNICDDMQLKMGDYFDAVADATHLPRPPRLRREDAAARFSEMQLSFLSESRRLSNRRMKRELRFKLRYPDLKSVLGVFTSSC